MIDRGKMIMGLVLLTAVFNGCTQGYDQSMMNNLNLVEQYTSCKIFLPVVIFPSKILQTSILMTTFSA
jgi:hypothetical protein